MVFDFLTPVDNLICNEIQKLSPLSIGKNLRIHKENNFPDLQDVKIAIVGVLDSRGFQKNTYGYTINYIRSAFYNLFPGNWEFVIADLGDVPIGEYINDTYFVLKNIIEELIKIDVTPIVIGGSQDHIYPIYRAFDIKNKLINYVSIDSKLDFQSDSKLPADSYLTKMILDEPSNLFNFANIGFQTYLNSQSEIEIVESLNFEAYRLGEIVAKTHLAEPIIRDADIVSIDMNCVKSSDSGNFVEFVPNGFNGKEICTLSRYAGIGDRVSCFGIFNHYGTKSESMLIAEIIWYFIEGLQYRSIESVNVKNSNFKKYIVPLEDLELIFYKSLVTERWWIELNSYLLSDSNKINQHIIPCSYDDYNKALRGDVSERFWKLLNKK